MKWPTGSILALVAPLAMSTILLADKEVNARGQGTFTVGGEVSKVVEARLELRNGDRFTATFQLKDGTTLELRGAVEGEGKHRKLSIKHGLAHEDLRGHGEFTLGDNAGTLRDISASGDLDGKRYSFEFQAGRESKGNPDNEDRHSFSDGADGTGRLDLGGDKMRVTHMRIDMSRNGDLHLHAEGPDMSDMSWSGRWSGDGPAYDVKLQDSDDADRMHAKGTITLSRNGKTFKSLEIDGKEDRQFFRLYFEGEAPREANGDSDHENRPSFSEDAFGNGRLDLGDDKMRVTHMRVHMSRNGDLRLHAEGPDMSDMKWTGRWSGDGPAYDVKLQDTRDGDGIHAKGSITLSRNGKVFKSLEIDGKQDGQFFHLYFEGE